MLELFGYDKGSKNQCYYRITGGMQICFAPQYKQLYDSSVRPACIFIRVYENNEYFYIKRSDSNDISKEEYSKLFSQLVSDEKVILSDEYIIDYMDS